MARRCLALRHVVFEDLGLFEPALEAAGYAIAYCEAAVEALDAEAVFQADLLVVLGGPIAVYDTEAYPFLAGEIEAVRRRLVANRPTLGICLGHQIMVTALGANVGPGPAKEIGWGAVAMTGEGARSPLVGLADIKVLHWHGDLAALPAGATRLAETALCRNQAFAMGPNILGLQFHVEADPGRIENWLVGHAAELAGARIDPRTIRDDSARYGDAAGRAGTAMLHSWLGGLNA